MNERGGQGVCVRASKGLCVEKYAVRGLSECCTLYNLAHQTYTSIRKAKRKKNERKKNTGKKKHRQWPEYCWEIVFKYRKRIYTSIRTFHWYTKTNV